MSVAIEIKGVSKSYGDIKALQNISFNVKEGELFGLIGPDGAGKSSLFRTLTTLILPDEGSAQVAGYDVVNDFRAIRQNIGYMPGRFSLYQDLTVEENLTFFATIFKTSIKENYHLIKDIYVQLEPFKDRPAGKLSGGMKQKLALCCALIHKPKVLFLDEPTVGVDVQSKNVIIQYLQELNKQGTTIIYTSHHLNEAENFCSRVAIIDHGKIVTKGKPNELIAKHDQAYNLEDVFLLLTGKALRDYA